MFTCLVSLLFASSVWAGSVPESDSGVMAPGCINCDDDDRGLVRKVAPLTKVVTRAPGLKLDKRYNHKCANFINANGLGEWGRTMVAAMRRVGEDCFFGSGRNPFGDLCPNYASLAQPQKESVAAIVWASVGQVEASCDPNEDEKGTNDWADGMFMLERSAEQRKDAGRHPRWCRPEQVVDTKSWAFQSECAASIMHDRACKIGKPVAARQSYWQKLKTPKRLISRMIVSSVRSAGLCKFAGNARRKK